MTDDRDRRSTSVDPASLNWMSAQKRPLTEMQALMETPPGGEAPESVEEQLALRELIADQIDKLGELDEWIFNVILNCRLSLRFAGRVLGIPKTTLARRRDAIYVTIGEAIKDHPLVAVRLKKEKHNE